MIASLSGRVQSLTAGYVVLDVGGVGYLVAITPATAGSISVGDSATLLISMIVREDAMLLFGFANTEERDFFDLLRGVSGVGPKLAQAVLSQLSPGEIAVAVAAEDDKAFAKVSGVGPKTAKLLVVTLAGRLKAQIQTSSGKGDATATDVRDSVVQALTGLGIPEKSAADVVDEALVKQPDASRESVLRDALATLGAAKGKR